MRLIGHLDNEAHATRASGLLVANGIPNLVEPDDGRRWAVWVHGEDDLARARQLLASFQAMPEDPRFREVALPRARVAARDDDELLTRAAAERAAPGKGAVAGAAHVGVATVVIALVCAGVAMTTRLSDDHSLVGRLQIAQVPFRLGASWALLLPEVRQGEVWRLFTPALLHFGWPHLLFNLWTFWDLGHAIERRRGTWALLGLTLGLGVVSNLGQYLAHGPRFGGLSGVIYGLLGYVWMLGRYRPSAGLALQPQIVVMMLVWFAICLTDSLGVPVANTAHGVGLLAGVAWGRWAARGGR